MKHAATTLTLAGLVIYACTGTETQNPSNETLKAFGNSGCKKEAAYAESTGDTATATFALVSTDYSAETAGLKCVAWEVVDATDIKIDLYNFEGACGANWVGDATISATDSLQLTLSNPGCSVASCGWCIYDWSFEVNGIATSQPLNVAVGIDTCPGEEAVETYSVVLPLSEQQSGIYCNYANYSALGWQALALSECGTLGMPCDGTSWCQSDLTLTTPTCYGELVCTDNGSTDELICATACSSDGDCGVLGVEACTAGICRPKNNW